MTHFDVILAGGGLANGLIAATLTARQPDLRVLLVESNDRIGGDHIWSFHETDVTPADLPVLEPFVRKRWQAQDVAFPAHSRRLSTVYYTISSTTLHERLVATLPDGMALLRSPIKSLTPGEVVLESGKVLTADCVIDGRGWRSADGERLALGYQKFVGLEYETREPHGLDYPIIMDATVEQTDGYRFVYSLPITPTRLLIEDTFYSDLPDLDTDGIAANIRAYAEQRNWQLGKLHHEEKGILPVVLAGQASAFEHTAPDIPCAGLRAGLFHPTTGYSLPDAVALARAIAGLSRPNSESVGRLVAETRRANWQARGFYRLLNRLLFVGAKGNTRRDVMQRFYRLPQDLIERFYGGRTTAFDKVRILSGRPPLPLQDAMLAFPPQAGVAFAQSMQRRRGTAP